MTGAKADVFISYRRGVDSDAAARLHDALKTGLSENMRVFRDIDSKQDLLGRNFLDVLVDRINKSTVVFVVIGQGWLDDLTRLQDSKDVVRAEISLALQDDDILVIPVLVGNVEMPETQDLPDVLQALPMRGGTRLSDDGYRTGVEALCTVIHDRVPAARNALEKFSAGLNGKIAGRRWVGIAISICLLGTLLIWLLYQAGIIQPSPAIVILMDSKLPDVVYDQQDRDNGNSNAKPIAEILDDSRDVRITPYSTSLDFTDDERVMAQNPDIIVIHASAFYKKTREAQANARLISFINAFSKEDTRFLIYSRVPINSLLETLVEGNPEFQGRITTLVVPVEGAESESFRDPLNGRMLKVKIAQLLGRPSG